LTDTLRVLLIEDNPRDARMLRDFVEASTAISVEWTACASLDMALDSLESEAFHLILLDVALSDSRGVDKASALLRSTRGTPVIALSGADDRELAAHMVRAASMWIEQGTHESSKRLILEQDSTAGKETAVLPDADRARLRSVMEAVPAFVYLQAPDHTIRFANRRFRSHFGNPEGRRCHEIFRGGNAPCSPCRTLEVLDTRTELVRTWTDHRGNTFELREIPFDDLDGTACVLVIGVDITEHIRVQRALQESEARHRLLFESAAVGIGYFSVEGDTIAINRNAAARLGGRPEDFVGRNMAQFLPHAEERLRRFAEASQLNDVISYEDVAGSGRDRRYVCRSYTALRDTEGNVTGIQVIASDITDQKRALQKLAESERRHRNVVESSPFGIVTVSMAGRITSCNRAFLAMVEFDEDEFLGKHFAKLPAVRARDLSKYVRAYRSILRGRSVDPFETSWTTGSGAVRHGEVHVTVMKHDGEPTNVQVIIQDVTKRKEAERSLRQSEENYRTIFDSANDAIMIHDAVTGRLLDVNRKTEQMFGYPVKEFLTLSVGDFSSGEPSHTNETALQRIHAAADGGPQVFEWHCRRKDGSLFWVEVSLRQVTLLGESVVLAVVRDVSERKQLEARLRQSQKLESIGTLASGVAHEINNPLMGMINYAELISSRVQDSSLKEFAEDIKLEGDRIAKIVRNLLSFARQDREQHSQARVRDIVNASLILVGSLLRKDLIQLDIDVPEDLPAVQCRSQQIQQVLINLLTNARDSVNQRFANMEGDKTVRIVSRVIHDPGDGKAWLRTSISDNGRGIPDDVKQRIFDPFFTTKPHEHGTGLGLSISYGIVREHGGRLSVESRPNEFAQFHVDLPLSTDDDTSS
jgi:PAS domain S-box-containing protein